MNYEKLQADIIQKKYPKVFHIDELEDGSIYLGDQRFLLRVPEDELLLRKDRIGNRVELSSVQRIIDSVKKGEEEELFISDKVLWFKDVPGHKVNVLTNDRGYKKYVAKWMIDLVTKESINLGFFGDSTRTSPVLVRHRDDAVETVWAILTIIRVKEDEANV